MIRIVTLAACAAALFWMTSPSLAQTPATAPAVVNILAGSDFTDGGKAWGGMGADDKRDVSIIDADGGKKALKLARKAAEGQARVDQTVKLKPQTLYKFAVTGYGKAPACIRLRPQSGKAKDFGVLYKPWATSSAPMLPGDKDKPATSELVFDSGLKADQAMVMVYLDGKDPGEYVITSIALSEMGSSKPADDEKIVLHLGDSVTISSYLPFEQRVEAVLGDLIAKQAPKAKVRQINYGADGEYVKELLTTGRYQKVVKENLERVDVVIIRYGANDSRFGKPEDFKTQLGLLCDAIAKDYPKATILIGTGPFLLGADDVNIKQYGPYWQAARDFAKDRKFGMIDIYDWFDKAQSAKLTRGPADIHPSPEGVKLMGEAIFVELERALGLKAQSQPTEERH